jgi:chromosome segregation protein
MMLSRGMLPRNIGCRLGATTLPGGTPAEEAAREAWAGLFIAECISRGITAVAITDHHDVALAPYLQRAAQAKGVIVYPGIEVTCSDNAQCLAILDPGADPAVLEKLLNMLPGVMAADTTGPKTCQILPIRWTVAELFDAVRKEEHLCENCIPLPHFSDGDAHKHLNEHGRHLRFAGLGCDGVYCEKPHAELDPVTLDKAYGLIPEWGTRRHAFIVTGDSRSDTFDFLGVRGCWLKLGEPTIEAVRQALLADEARIAYQAPETPLERIAEIRLNGLHPVPRTPS